jgi:hypothetical protein
MSTNQQYYGPYVTPYAGTNGYTQPPMTGQGYQNYQGMNGQTYQGMTGQPYPPMTGGQNYPPMGGDQTYPPMAGQGYQGMNGQNYQGLTGQSLNYGMITVQTPDGRQGTLAQDVDLRQSVCWTPAPNSTSNCNCNSGQPTAYWTCQ